MDIDLKSQLTLLKSLQDVDVLLHHIDTKLAEIPHKIENAASEFNAINNAVLTKQAEKAELEKKRKSEELELEAHMDRTKEREGKLFTIKTNKEYQAAIKEIADAKQISKEKEESVIRIMEKIDALNKEITQLSTGIADKEKAFREKELEFKKVEASLLAEKKEKQALNREEEAKIDPKVLRQYRYIQQKFPDALAVATSGICMGCNKRVPPQLYIELQKWKELVMCPNCHRILFFEEKQETVGNDKA